MINLSRMGYPPARTAFNQGIQSFGRKLSTNRYSNGFQTESSTKVSHLIAGYTAGTLFTGGYYMCKMADNYAWHIEGLTRKEADKEALRLAKIGLGLGIVWPVTLPAMIVTMD